MRLATIRTASGPRCVRIDGERAVETGQADVGELLRDGDWRTIAARSSGTTHGLEDLDYAPLVPRPDKIICVGLNYASHIREMGRDRPAYPTIFAKFPEALVGANDDIVLPAASQAMDWEAELAVVVGAVARHLDPVAAHEAVAGYAVLNDVTARDWQHRTVQWLQGKTFEATTPFGPHLVTPDEAGTGLDLVCDVDGDRVQAANTADLVFDAAATIAYVSTILTLRPGDVLSLGTPGGVGQAREPKRYLQPGAVLTTSIAGLGQCRNLCLAEKPA
jgi:acylpyruvate hydrolase